MGSLWERLVEFRRRGLPMGCGTDSNPELKEVGLCGSHAYSILDVREARMLPSAAAASSSSSTLRGGEESVRLLRIRNPHGQGEWNGAWSDKSAQWAALVTAEARTSGGGVMARPTGTDDGTFWMDFTSFVMAFGQVDVCFALPGWHALSIQNSFPPNNDRHWRTCSSLLLLTFSPGVRKEATVTVFITALQPTKRGSWCRADRKKRFPLTPRPRAISLCISIARLNISLHSLNRTTFTKHKSVLHDLDRKSVV